MAGVTVEFGAKDTGLQQTLQTVQNELTALKKDLSDGSLSFDELNQAMRKVAQAERLEAQLQRIANETEQAGNEAANAAEDLKQLAREQANLDAAMRRAEQITRSNRSAFEIYSQEIDELTDHLNAGRISQETYGRAVDRAEAALKRASQTTDQAGDEAVGAANDFDKLDREMDQVAANSGTTGVSMGQLRSAFTKITGVIASVTAALQSMRVAFNYAQEGVQLAMGLEETMNRVGEIFGSSAMQIEQWSQGSVRGLAMTEEQAMSAASEFAIFGRSAGLAGDDLVGFSTRLTRLATDIASFNNAEPEEGVRAIGAALRGESEPIRRFGVLLDEATLKNRALQMGLIETTTGALTPQQRVLAAYNEILAQTTTQQGDFARTAEGAANQTKILSASLTQIQTDIGSGLLPAWESFIGYLNTVAVPGLEVVVNKLGELATGSSEAAESLGLTGEEASGFGQMLFRASGAINPFLGALNQTDSVLRLLAGSAEEAADEANQTSAEIESLGRMMDAASGQTMTLTNSMNGLGTGGTFTNVNSEAEKFSGLLGDSSIKLNDADAALGTMNPKLTAQNALYGEIDTTIGNSQAQLGAQLSIIEATIGKQRESNSEEDKKNAKIAEREALLAQQQAQALEEYNLQIQINEAIAAGNTEQAGMLETKQELVSLADQIAQKTGLSTEKARQLAAEYLISKNNADATTEASKSLADRIEEADDEAKRLRQTIGDIAGKDMERGAKGLRERTKEARDEMKGLETIIGQVGGMSLDDMLKKMGLDPQSFDNTGEKLDALEDNLEALKGMDAADVTPYIDDDGLTTSVDDIKGKLADLEAPANKADATPEIDQEDFANQVNDIIEQLNGLEDQPITTELDAGDSIQNIREALEEPVQVQIDESAFDAAVASMNAEITNNFRGGDGGEGGDATGGQGGEGGPGGDAIADISQVVNILNPWTQVITAIRDRLPLQALAY